MSKFVSHLLAGIILLLSISFTPVNPALATTINFSWEGKGGYAAKGSFSYDEKKVPASFSEKGAGKTKFLQSLNISFFNPDSMKIAAYDSVKNGVAKGQYFQFNFNSVTHKMFGKIDMGGELRQENYLSGIVNSELSLIHVPDSGSDRVLDTNSGAVSLDK